MATVNYQEFLPEVLPFVPGCADIVAINAIRNAAIEFCADSYYWQELQDPNTVTASDLPYDIDAAMGAQCIQILDCIVNGKSIRPLRMDFMDANVINWRVLTSPEVLEYYQINPGQVCLYPIPDQAVTMQIRAAYTPLRNSTGIEQYVYQNYLEGIAAGALARLLRTSNPTLAATFEATFRNEKFEARVDAEKSFSRVSMRVQPRRFC